MGTRIAASLLLSWAPPRSRLRWPQRRVVAAGLVRRQRQLPDDPVLRAPEPQDRSRSGLGLVLARAMLKLAHGIEKERHDRPAARYRFAFLSSTNVALADVMRGLPPAEAEATGVRVATIPAAASRYGVFDRLPPGCATSKAAADEVVQDATEHHCHAARAFTAELERRLATPIGGALLKRRLVRNLNAIRRRAGHADAQF